jgi:hypothetical protein
MARSTLCFADPVMMSDPFQVDTFGSTETRAPNWAMGIPEHLCVAMSRTLAGNDPAAAAAITQP